MPTIKLASEVVTHEFLLDNNEILRVEAKQVDGQAMLRYSSRTRPRMGVIEDPSSGPEVQYEISDGLYRTGLQAYFSLVETNLTDENGNDLLRKSQSVESFLAVWAHPALDQPALTVHNPDGDDVYSYRDLIMQAVRKANPQWDTGIFRQEAPTTGELSD